MALNPTQNPGSLSAETARRDRLQGEPGARRGDDAAARPGHFAGLMSAQASAHANAQASAVTPEAARSADGLAARAQAARAQAARVAQAASDRAQGAAAEAPDAEGDDESGASTSTSPPSAHANRSGRPAGRASPGAGATPAEGTDPARPGAADAQARAKGPAEAGMDSMPPWLQSFEAMRRAAGRAETGAASGDASAAGSAPDRAADTAGRGARPPAAGLTPAPREALADAAAPTSPVSSPTGAGAAPPGDGFAQAVQAFQSSTSAPAATVAEAAPVQQTVPVPVQDPDFGAQVMLQVSDLAQAGVTEAQLHLNPAEMGPIRIHIAMDGQSARIDFEAGHADTRALLESALPALAQALREDGLQLDRSTVVQVADLPAPTASADAGSPNGGGSAPGRDGAADSSGRGGVSGAPGAPGRAGRLGPGGAGGGGSVLPGWDPLAARVAPRAGGLDLYA